MEPLETLDAAALLVAIVAALNYLNFRFLRLPPAIGLLLSALLISLGIVGLGSLEVRFAAEARGVLHSFNFEATLMDGMLGFLLFAGALHADLKPLAKQKWTIGFLATAGVVISTAVVGCAGYGLLAMLGAPVPLIYCLIFGAVISPTDPIAVLGLLKSAGVGKDLEVRIAGESLFNDGIAVVIFTVLTAFAAGSQTPTAGSVSLLLLEEAGGGVLFGLILGYLAFRLLCSIDNYQAEILVTLAIVMGGYALAGALHVSGPLALVVAGLIVGNPVKTRAMSAITREHLFQFWDLLDVMLNAALFVMIGLEVLVLPFSIPLALTGVAAIPLVLLVRLGIVSLPALLPRLRPGFSRHAIRVLTWGGLRGGVSVALALSLDHSAFREPIIAVTYVVVVFSVLVQGLTISRVARGQA
jgi:monovalent cation:H+ antiporter, CPA1 family